MKCSKKTCDRATTLNYSMCKRCREWYRLWSKRKRSAKAKNGLCYFGSCQDKSRPGRSMCGTHAAYHCAATLACLARRKANGTKKVTGSPRLLQQFDNVL